MHDFVCCENVENCFNFSSEDITLTPNVLYLHPIYSSFHSSHITIDENDNPSCEFLCKENYSICDLFHPITSMMLSSTASIAPPSDSKSKKNENGNNWKFFLPVLSMDRCLIRLVSLLLLFFQLIFSRCRRCKSHIGEGILKLDESEPIPSADDEFHFKLSDMESVKIFNHSVRLEHWMKNMIPTIISQPQIDQVGKCNTCCWYLSNLRVFIPYPRYLFACVFMCMRSTISPLCVFIVPSKFLLSNNQQLTRKRFSKFLIILL